MVCDVTWEMESGLLVVCDVTWEMESGLLGVDTRVFVVKVGREGIK